MSVAVNRALRGLRRGGSSLSYACLQIADLMNGPADLRWGKANLEFAGALEFRQ